MRMARSKTRFILIWDYYHIEERDDGLWFKGAIDGPSVGPYPSFAALAEQDPKIVGVFLCMLKFVCSFLQEAAHVAHRNTYWELSTSSLSSLSCWPSMADTITVWLVRVIQVELDDGEYFYQQIETNERFGPFPTVASTAHMHDITF